MDDLKRHFIPTLPRRYVSIDGGTSTVGLTYFTVEDGKMVILANHLLDVRKDDLPHEYLRVRHGPLITRIVRLKQMFQTWLDSLEHPPLMVFYESHFLNPKRPTSVIPLVRFMQVVEETLVERGIVMETIAPQEMKRSIRVTGKLAKADKDAIRKAIKALMIQGDISIVPLDALSEHEVDSIGIGYSGMLKYPGLSPTP